MIELAVHGAPAACRSAAEQGRSAARSIGDVAARVRHAGTGSTSSWEGMAGDGFRTSVSETAGDLEDLRSRVDPACDALDAFAGELDVVRTELAAVRSMAGSAGLQVTGDAVLPPTSPGDAAGAGQLDAFNEKVRVYNESFAKAEAARAKERRAHDSLGTAMKASNGDGWLDNLLERLGLAPPDGMDPVTGPRWLLGLGLTGFGVAANGMVRAGLGRWQPWFKTDAGHWQLGSPKGLSAWDRFRLGLRRGDMAERDWRAKPYQSAARGRWQSAGKWAGRAGVPLTAVASGWQQWKADADDPSLDTGERADRTATKAAATTAGAWAGAKGGAFIGGAIGTAIAPGVGTVIGGAIGGVVGGVGGAFAGGAAGDWINEHWDGAVHAVGDLGSDAVDAVADLGGDVVDAAEDVGDTLTFWD